MRVRTRYAPSPTGKMHVGNLRTALYAYLIAKHESGDFLLRIEDTDQERFVEGSIDIIYRTMESAGLIPDEGPNNEGDLGPYVQSERQKKGIYLNYAKKLIEKREAYFCFCSKERLDKLRNNNDQSKNTCKYDKHTCKYDKHCISLSEEEIQEKLSLGVPYIIRQDNPIDGQTSFEDVIYGTITVDNAELDDMILIKSDGYPTYNFANVIDDYLMNITHIVRGNEYLASSPKYNRLYHAFDWEVPIYVHVPLITNEEHQKLSKRSGHASYEDLIDQGFLSQVIINFVALLGWSPSNNNEIFTLEELVKEFDYKKINKSPAVFDINKFRWMNSEYIKNMDSDEFFELANPFIAKVITSKELDIKKISNLVQSRIEVLNDIVMHVDFFNELPDYDITLYNHKRMKTNPENSMESLEKVLPILQAQIDWSIDGLHECIMEFVKELGIKNGQMLWPLRTALSGKPTSPGGAFDLMNIFGKNDTIRRIKMGIEKIKNS